MANLKGEAYNKTEPLPPLSTEAKRLAAIALQDAGRDELASAINGLNGYPVPGYAMFVIRDDIQEHIEISGGHPEGQAFLDTVEEWDGPVVALKRK